MPITNIYINTVMVIIIGYIKVGYLFYEMFPFRRMYKK